MRRQILTRLEAFLESLRVKKGENMLFRSKRQSPESKGIPLQTADNGSNNKTAAADHPAAASASAPVYVMGIDSGSTSTNAVILNQNRELNRICRHPHRCQKRRKCTTHFERDFRKSRTATL